MTRGVNLRRLRRKRASLLAGLFDDSWGELDSDDCGPILLKPRGLSNRGNSSKPREEASWTPKGDIYFTHEGLVVAVDLPGLDREDFDVTLEGSRLVIQGQRSVDGDIEHVEHWESPSGPFYLSLELPDSVVKEEADGRMKNGRLSIVFPYCGGPIFEGNYRVVVSQD